MKIAIPIMGNDINSQISPRFGRSSSYLIVDSETGDVQSISNPAAGAARGAGVASAQIIASKNVDAVVVVFIGPNAYQALSAAGVNVFQANDSIKAKEVIRQIEDGSLKEMSDPTGPPDQGGGLAQRQRKGKNRG